MRNNYFYIIKEMNYEDMKNLSTYILEKLIVRANNNEYDNAANPDSE